MPSLDQMSECQFEMTSTDLESFGLVRYFDKFVFWHDDGPTFEPVEVRPNLCPTIHTEFNFSIVPSLPQKASYELEMAAPELELSQFGLVFEKFMLWHNDHPKALLYKVAFIAISVPFTGWLMTQLF